MLDIRSSMLSKFGFLRSIKDYLEKPKVNVWFKYFILLIDFSFLFIVCNMVYRLSVKEELAQGDNKVNEKFSDNDLYSPSQIFAIVISISLVIRIFVWILDVKY